MDKIPEVTLSLDKNGDLIQITEGGSETYVLSPEERERRKSEEQVVEDQELAIIDTEAVAQGQVVNLLTNEQMAQSINNEVNETRPHLRGQAVDIPYVGIDWGVGSYVSVQSALDTIGSVIATDDDGRLLVGNSGLSISGDVTINDKTLEEIIDARVNKILGERAQKISRAKTVALSKKLKRVSSILNKLAPRTT